MGEEHGPISLYLHVSPYISQVACLVELSKPGLLVLSLPQEHGMALGLAPPQPHWNLSGLAAAAEVRLRARVGD